jgi:hypothetical protein
MADANTTRYGFVKPEVGASADSWGGKLNGVFDDYDVLLGAITTTGGTTAYVLTTGLALNASPAVYVAGQTFWIKINVTNTGASTINVDTLGAKNITKNGTTALAAGDLVSGNIYAISYDGTQFQIVGSVGAGNQPLDATLTALANGTTGADVLFYWSGVDTLSTMTFPSASRTQIAAGLGTAALRTAPTGVLVGDTDAQTLTNKTLTTPTINGAALSGTLSGTPNFSGAWTSTSRPAYGGNTALDAGNGAQLAASNVFTGAEQKISNTAANNIRYVFDVTDAGANQRYTWMYATATTWNVLFINDALNASTTPLSISRSGKDALVATFATCDLRIEPSPASLADNSAGFRRLPDASITTGTPVLTDSSKLIRASGGVTMPANVFAKGDVVVIWAGGSSRTITQGASLTMTKEVLGTTGNATLAANATAVVTYDSATTCHISNVS